MLILTVLTMVPALISAPAGPSSTLPATVEFNRDIRPIMSNTCFKCHGPDVKNNKSALRLDLAELAVAPFKNAKGRVITPIVPGKPEQSEVWRRVSSNDRGEMMPPPDSLHQLTPRDKALLKRWIEQGANYQPHWAYIAPVKTPPPGRNGHPIDRFIGAELEARDLKPSPEADRRTLIRRLSLDLTGLPPTPDEVEEFVADGRTHAYEQLVDRLLASKHFGERMAVPWLDLVRFADSVGFHGDQRQNIFPYRDYVINAFNRNKPFDEFVTEQLAGDLLPNATDEQRTASGYNRLNMMTREGGAQAKEYIAKYTADRVRTVSGTFLGSTLGCAECHDHKFDPFTTRDFYAMAAYFADIRQWGVYNDYPYTPEPELTGFTNDYPFPPELDVENETLKRRLARLRVQFAERVATAGRELAANPDARDAIRQWVSQVAPRLQRDAGGWAVASIDVVKAAPGITTVTLPDQSVRFDDPSAFVHPMTPGGVRKSGEPHVLTLRVPAGPLATVRLEALPDEAQGGVVGRNQKETFTLSLKLALLRAGETKPQAIEIADGYADGDTQSYSNGYLLTSLRDKWTSARTRAKERQGVDFLLRKPLTLGEGDRLVATVRSGDVGRVRFSVTPLGGRFPGETPDVETLKAFAAADPTPEQSERLAGQYFLGTGGTDEARFAAAFDDLRAIAACRDGKAFTMVTVSTTPVTTRVLPRGNWQDESGEIVQPEPPRFLGGQAKATFAARAKGEPATRLDLASWIVSRENPLTARTFVNRLWKQFFGTGLSAVVDDLGLQGEYPSHPELLDWLAVEFMERGWDVKAMVKLIVTSSTYQQSSKMRPELRDVDPQNRLLARQNPRRLDAEFVRDNALFAAGLLSPEVGGPSATPYQPEGYYAQLSPPLRTYEAERDERQYRRGLYVHWQRTFLHPMLAAFDAPSREECTASRTLSSTPQQALTLLNDPTFVEAARVLAERTILAGSDANFRLRLDLAFRCVLARPPSDREVESLRRLYEAQLEVYRAAPDEARKVVGIGLRDASSKVDRIELAAWTSVARVILNLNETIVVY